MIIDIILAKCNFCIKMRIVSGQRLTERARQVTVHAEMINREDEVYVQAVWWCGNNDTK